MDVSPVIINIIKIIILDSQFLLFSLVSFLFQVCFTLSGTERPCLWCYDFHRSGTHAQVSASLGKYPQSLVT